LLADQIPVSKISDIIRTVLKSFNPSMNVEKLNLPKKTCASYMRKEELKIISDAHKPQMISKDVREGKGIYLNTDGTTKQQKKLGGVVANSMVISVNELPDGKAISIVENISREFEKIKRIAKMLNLPSANSGLW
jgi:translation initiation factor 1 (eIF-1/SUI1)